jgi:hypothetical protein
MGKLFFSIAIGALVMVAAEDFKIADLSVRHLLAAVQEGGRALVPARK